LDISNLSACLISAFINAAGVALQYIGIEIAGIPLLLFSLLGLFSVFIMNHQKNRAKKVFVSPGNMDEKKSFRKGLVTLGDLKWMVEYFSDATATVENVPFCGFHSARLIEHDGLYVCPKRGRHCDDISQKDIQLLHKQAKSLIEADILRMIENAKSHPTKQ